MPDTTTLAELEIREEAAFKELLAARKHAEKLAEGWRDLYQQMMTARRPLLVRRNPGILCSDLLSQRIKKL